MNNFGYHFWNLMPKLWTGALTTIEITSLAVFFGMVIGMIMALAKLSSVKILKVIS